MKIAKALSIVSALSIGLAFGTAASASAYKASDLGGLNDSWAVAMGINASGQVVGSSYSAAGEEHAFLTGANGHGMLDLGTLGGFGSYASAVNDKGQVVGGFYGAENYGHAFITDPGGKGMRDLGTLGGSVSYAHGINASGQVVGDSKTIGDGASHAFITDVDGGKMRDLGTGGQPMSYARSLNDSGEVVGFAGFVEADGKPIDGRLFVTGPGGHAISDLGVQGPEARVEAINAQGQVIGSSKDGAFLTSANGELTYLSGSGSFAFGINSQGQVVGSDETGRAFVTGPNGQGRTDLNSLVDFLPEDVYLVDARGINDLGQIIANGSDMHAYLISPSVPEPSSEVLALGGFAVLGFAGHCRSRKVLQKARYP